MVTPDHLGEFKRKDKGSSLAFAAYNQESTESLHVWLRESFPELTKKIMLFSPLRCNEMVY